MDEALAGYFNEIIVVIGEEHSITVTDNGRGIPVGMLEKEGRPAVEVILTILHAGGIRTERGKERGTESERSWHSDRAR